jgi:hypothetical protein
MGTGKLKPKHLTKVPIPNIEIALPAGWETIGDAPRHIRENEWFFQLIVADGAVRSADIQKWISSTPTANKFWPVRKARPRDTDRIAMHRAVQLNELYPKGIPDIPDDFEPTGYMVFSRHPSDGEYMLLPNGCVVERTETQATFGLPAFLLGLRLRVRPVA